MIGNDNNEKSKSLLSVLLVDDSKKILNDVIFHMRLRRNKAHDKLVTDLRDPEIYNKFKEFTKNFKITNTTKTATHYSAYFAEETLEELDQRKFEFRIGFNTIFFKTLYYFYYHTNIEDISDYLKQTYMPDYDKEPWKYF